MSENYFTYFLIFINIFDQRQENPLLYINYQTLKQTMPSKIFNALLEEQTQIFKNGFLNVSSAVFYDDEKKRMIHNQEYGVYREKICKEFIKFFIPQNYMISDGFIINNNDEVSHQCDIIIYDRNFTPLLQSENKQRFFPVETIAAIGEIKSNVTFAELKIALKKLSNLKKIRKNIKSPEIFTRQFNTSDSQYRPEILGFDQIITFLICRKLNFDLSDLPNKINSVYKGIDDSLRHNMILSIEDGLLYYVAPNDSDLCYPININDNYELELCKNKFITPQKENNSHINFFINSLFKSISATTILHPNILSYIKPVNILTNEVSEK